jgi:cold shock CspA family protein
MRVGTVKWFHKTRGSGFIRPYDESNDVFVHMDTVREAGMLVLTEGDKVRFEIGQHNGRRAAVNLELLVTSLEFSKWFLFYLTYVTCNVFEALRNKLMLCSIVAIDLITDRL